MNSTETVIKPVYGEGVLYLASEQDWGLEDETWVCTNGFTGV